MHPDSPHSRAQFDSHQLQLLFDALQRRGYAVVGPTVRDDAIILDVLSSARDLPAGWGTREEKAAYRLVKRPDNALFGYTLSPQSWKRHLHLPDSCLLTSQHNREGSRILPAECSPAKQAFLGVRSCELHAIEILDRVLLNGAYTDEAYRVRRTNTIIIAVNCTEAGSTCFCESMNTGPGTTGGFDLVLTEIVGVGRHYFIAESGTKMGDEILSEVSTTQPSNEDLGAAAEFLAHAAAQMGRRVDTVNIRDLLIGSPAHPRWEQVAGRCMTCGNCTMVCPTCFCTLVEDSTDLTGELARRHRSWASCFTLDFSYIHGGSVRSSTKARYRQWLTHKFAAWIDQFGRSGCVGCGRCITWCPAGIDVTEELAALRTVPVPDKEPFSEKETAHGIA